MEITRCLRLLLLAGCCAVMASCAATAPVSSDGQERQLGKDVFQSEDLFVIIARSGDTPQSLAAKYLGDPTKSWMIEDYNNTTSITPGQLVAIPRRYWNLSGVTPAGYQIVPILVYHNLAPQAKGRMILGAKAFDEQMRYLKAQGYHVISVKDYVEFTSLKRQIPRKSVLLTFDDGFRSFLQYAYPVLKELGFPATLFIYTDYVGAGSNALSWADLKKLAAEGFDIQSHSKSHGDMVRAAGELAAEYDRRLESELSQPKAQFQKNLGFTPDILAYPYGRQDDVVAQRTKERGYTAAFTVRRQGSQSFVDPYRVHRMQIYPEMNMDEFVRALSVFSRENIQ